MQSLILGMKAMTEKLTKSQENTIMATANALNSISVGGEFEQTMQWKFIDMLLSDFGLEPTDKMKNIRKNVGKRPDLADDNEVKELVARKTFSTLIYQSKNNHLDISDMKDIINNRLEPKVNKLFNDFDINDISKNTYMEDEEDD